MTFTTEELVQTVAAYEANDRNQRATALSLGLARSTLQNRLRRAAERGLLGFSPVLEGFAVKSVASKTADGSWVKQVKEHGATWEVPTGHRVRAVSALVDAEGRIIQQWQKTGELEHTPEGLASLIATAMANIAPVPAAPAPSQTFDDLLTLYPVVDMHLGMHAWGQETGGPDYDLRAAGEDMRHSLGKILKLSPCGAEAVLVLGGDTLHADDNRAETPAHKHKLDVDGRQFKVIDVAIELICGMVDSLLAKHRHVTVRVLRGNHDEHSHLVLTFALFERYRDEPRVSIEKKPRDLFMRQWGKSAIFVHHGDKAPPERQALYLSDVCPFWSATVHRYYFTGHRHSDQAKDIGPLKWEQLRPFCPPDNYAASMGYGARRALQSFTFDKNDGLTLRAVDPINRAAAYAAANDNNEQERKAA